MSDPATPTLFDDGKDAEALRTIGEVCRALGIRPHVLRYWEEQFPMLQPLKRSGGRRYYRAEDVRLVAAIDRLVHREGYTLRGARLALEGGVSAPAVPEGQVGQAALAPQDSRIVERLTAIRNELAAALD